MTVMPYDFKEGMDMTRLYYGTDTRMYALLLGAALGLSHAHRAYDGESRNRKKTAISFLYMAGIVLTAAGYFFLDGRLPAVYEWAMAAYTILFLLLLVWTADTSLPFGNGWIILSFAGLESTAMVFSCGSIPSFFYSVI